MSAGERNRSERRDMLHSFIQEHAGMAEIQLKILTQYSELGDDDGLRAATRRFISYAKVIAETARDLARLQANEVEDG